MGMSLSDLDEITIGFILDMVDASNVDNDSTVEADTDMIDRFFG